MASTFAFAGAVFEVVYKKSGRTYKISGLDSAAALDNLKSSWEDPEI